MGKVKEDNKQVQANKPTYEQLEQEYLNMVQRYNALSKSYEKIREAQEIQLLFKKTDVCLKVIEMSDKFSLDFVQRCIDIIESAFPSEQLTEEDNNGEDKA